MFKRVYVRLTVSHYSSRDEIFFLFSSLKFYCILYCWGVAKAKVDTKGWGNEGDGDAWYEKPKGQIKRKSENKR